VCVCVCVCVCARVQVSEKQTWVGIGAGEDMWHAYNLILEGDQVTATTFRKVAASTGESGKGSASERVKIKLTIEVESIDFDPEGKFLAALLSVSVTFQDLDETCHHTRCMILRPLHMGMKGGRVQPACG
jgi:stalled ribosome rescue protein Dom34